MVASRSCRPDPGKSYMLLTCPARAENSVVLVYIEKASTGCTILNKMAQCSC